MKSFKTMLPALGLVLGATLAMAMNFPTMVTEKTDSVLWTPDSDEIYEPTNYYREVTDIVAANDYVCNLSSMECIVEFSNDDPNTGIPNVLQQGEFVEQ